MSDKLTIAEIEQWIDNDEGLYNWWKSSRKPKVSRFTGNTVGTTAMSKRDFIKENRAEIETAINNVTSSKRPAHYLAYPSR